MIMSDLLKKKYMASPVDGDGTGSPAAPPPAEGDPDGEGDPPEPPKPGIKNMTYNASLRIFETTLLDDSRGPDISVDALILKDATKTALINESRELSTKNTTTKSSIDRAISGFNSIKTSYNNALAQLTNIVNEIEGLVNTNNGRS